MNQRSVSLRSTDTALAVGLVGTVVGLVGLLGCCAGLGHIAGAPKNGIRVEQVESEIQEALPLGSTRGEVETWFASHALEPSEIRDENRPVGLSATIPNDSWLDKARICIALYFDANNRLKDRRVYRDVPSL